MDPRCSTCQVPDGLPCPATPEQCRQAEADGFLRGLLVKHARARRAGATDPAEAARLRRARKPRVPLGARPKGG